MTYWKDPDLISFQTIDCSGLACTLSQKNGFSFVLGASSSPELAGPGDAGGAFLPRLIGGGGRGPFGPGGGGGLGPPEPGGGAGGGGLGGPAEDGMGGGGGEEEGAEEDFFEEDTFRNLGGSGGSGSTLPEGGFHEILEDFLPGGAFNGGIP